MTRLTHFGQATKALAKFFSKPILHYAIAVHDLTLILSILECQGINGEDALDFLRAYTDGGVNHG